MWPGVSSRPRCPDLSPRFFTWFRPWSQGSEHKLNKRHSDQQTSLQWFYNEGDVGVLIFNVPWLMFVGHSRPLFTDTSSQISSRSSEQNNTPQKKRMKHMKEKQNGHKTDRKHVWSKLTRLKNIKQTKKNNKTHKKSTLHTQTDQTHTQRHTTETKHKNNSMNVEKLL